MVTNKEVTFVIARTFEGELLIVDATDSIRDLLDGLTCEDNLMQNTEIIPEETGLYLVKCKFYCDDGQNFNAEPFDCSWEFTCKRVTQIYKW